MKFIYFNFDLVFTFKIINYTTDYIEFIQAQ